MILTASPGGSLIVTDALIERFGTLTIIVLGGILTSVVAGLAGQPLDGLTLGVGLVAVVVGFGAWWTYFDFTGQRQPKPTRPATAQWILSHLPLTATIAAMGPDHRASNQRDDESASLRRAAASAASVSAAARWAFMWAPASAPAAADAPT